MEDLLEPDLAICDPHHHLWDRAGNRYLLEDLKADTDSGHHVVHTVFVECISGYRPDGPEAFRPVGETEFVVAMDPGGFVAGIVGFADLRAPEVADVLAAHVEAGDGRFRGIRHGSALDRSPDIHASHTNPPPGLLGQPDFRRGLTALGKAGLSFDAWLYHPQVPELTDLARSHPDVPIVIDHLGGPLGIGPYTDRAETLSFWRAAMAELATCPNVTLKLGGIGMPIYGMMKWHQRPGRRLVGGAGGGMGGRDPLVHRPVRRGPLHVRVQLPCRPGGVHLPRTVERFQASRLRRQPRRQSDAVSRHRGALLPFVRSSVERRDDNRLDGIAASGRGNGILELLEAEPVSDEIGEAQPFAVLSGNLNGGCEIVHRRRAQRTDHGLAAIVQPYRVEWHRPVTGKDPQDKVPASGGKHAHAFRKGLHLPGALDHRLGTPASSQLEQARGALRDGGGGETDRRGRTKNPGCLEAMRRLPDHDHLAGEGEARQHGHGEADWSAPLYHYRLTRAKTAQPGHSTQRGRHSTPKSDDCIEIGVIRNAMEGITRR
jgi:predicted TIM-barrel fold metal-dependent hydrolase